LFFFQAEDGIRAFHVTGVQTCALPISRDTRGSAPYPGEIPRGSRGVPPYCLLRNNSTSLLDRRGCADWQHRNRRASAAPRVMPRSEERRVGKGGGARGTRRQRKRDGAE